MLCACSCASLSKKQCETGNWYALGREDGTQGEKQDQFNDYRKACQKHGIAAQWPSYWKGHQAGLKEFCTTDNGFRQGRLGFPYNGVCPGELDDLFRAAHQRGQISTQVHALQEKVTALEEKLKSAETREETAALKKEIKGLKRTVRTYR